MDWRRHTGRPYFGSPGPQWSGGPGPCCTPAPQHSRFLHPEVGHERSQHAPPRQGDPPRQSGVSPTLILVLALVAAGGIAAFLLWRRRRGLRENTTPILLFEVRTGVDPARRPEAGEAGPGEEDPGGTEPQGPDPRAAGSAPAGDTSSIPEAGEGRGTRSEEVPPGDLPSPSEVRSESVTAGPVSFDRAADGTLQLLPGRLVIESDAGKGEEIRFVRVPGAPAQVTFGRRSGPAHRHVQLSSPTVSRLHAELTFEEGAWTLRNHSATNPTVLNGRSLGSQVYGVQLQDGDRVEMGEVVFLFRQPQGQDRLATRSSWHTDRGLRSMNQDAVVVRSLPGRKELAAVCDGMGSPEGGGVASRLALEALTGALEQGASLHEAVRLANGEVRKGAAQDDALDGMGTTLVALLREEDEYTVANVGDSRAYAVDEGGIRQLTRDHSFVAEAMASGEMSEEEALRSPWRHAITRNLGGSDAVEVDLFPGGSPEHPHAVVLCTDGIHGVLAESEIEEVVRQSPHIRDTARLLCEEAIRKGSQDNVTAAVIAFAGGLSGETV
jgi:PPM family protein phosphatase